MAGPWLLVMTLWAAMFNVTEMIVLNMVALHFGEVVHHKPRATAKIATIVDGRF